MINSVKQMNINEIRATSKTIADRLGLDSDDSNLVIELIVLSAGERTYKGGHRLLGVWSCTDG
jgi:hypothetical protein